MKIQRLFLALFLLGYIVNSIAMQTEDNQNNNLGSSGHRSNTFTNNFDNGRRFNPRVESAFEIIARWLEATEGYTTFVGKENNKLRNEVNKLSRETESLRKDADILNNPHKTLLLQLSQGFGQGVAYTLAAAGQTFGPGVFLYGYQKYIDDLSSAELMLSEKMEEFKNFTTLDKLCFGGTTVDKNGNKVEVQSVLDVFGQELIKYCPNSDLQKSIIQLLPPLRVMLHLSLSRMSPANQIRANSVVMDIKKDFGKIDSIFKDLITFAEKDMPWEAKKQFRKDLENELNILFKGIITKCFCIPYYSDENIYAMIDWQKYFHTEDTEDENSNVDEDSQDSTPVFEQDVKLEPVDTSIFD